MIFVFLIGKNFVFRLDQKTNTLVFEASATRIATGDALAFAFDRDTGSSGACVCFCIVLIQ